MDEVLQLVGAIMILVAFAAAQFRLLDQQTYTYVVLNLFGSAILAYLAYTDRQWGFLLLEGVWAIVSFWGLVALVRGVPSSR